MNLFRNKFAAWTAVAALGAASLFAAETTAAAGHGHRGRGAFFSKFLNLTDAQQSQAKAIFEDARQSAEPVRSQLKQTRESLRAAVQSNNTAQIQQLSATEGSEIGQLSAIHSGAMAKVYQILTPEQQQKLASMRQAREARRAARHQGGSQAPVSPSQQ
jgi:Spy/CpxP family protein refolding chaperone